MGKKKYPYEVRGVGYIHRPSHTYLEDGKFLESMGITKESKKQDLKEDIRAIEELETGLTLLKDEDAIRITEREIRRRITALVLRAVVEDN